MGFLGGWWGRWDCLFGYETRDKPLGTVSGVFPWEGTMVLEREAGRENVIELVRIHDHVNLNFEL